MNLPWHVPCGSKKNKGQVLRLLHVGNAGTEPSLRKALAIGADDAIRIDAEATDGFFVAKQLAEVAKSNGYDLILAGRESIDYNGGMVPGMLATFLDYNFVNACIGLEIENKRLQLLREIDGGSETLSNFVTLVLPVKKDW